MNHYAEYRDGRWFAFRTTNGLDRIRVGPPWLTPHDAARYADSLDHTPDVRPTRGTDEPRRDASDEAVRRSREAPDASTAIERPLAAGDRARNPLTGAVAT